MKSLFILIIVVGVVFVLSKLAKLRSGAVSEEEVWPFYGKNVLSPPERILYLKLVQALPEYMVLAQVQLSRFLGVKKGNNYQAWLNRINRMSADFVVCAKDSSVLAIVELDDSSHERPDRKIADAKKNKALASAGLRIIRWNVKSIPDVASIRAELVVPANKQADATLAEPTVALKVGHASATSGKGDITA